MTKETLQAAIKHISPWATTTIFPLRSLRRQMKNLYGTSDPEVEAIRHTIKNAELQAEHQQQRMLEKLSADWTRSVSAITPGNNLRCYLDTLGILEAEKEIVVRELHPLP